LNQIQVLFYAASGDVLSAGDAVDLVVYEDADGDPANGATLQATYSVTVQAVDGASWSVYDLSPPLALNGPGDVLIAVINRYVESGVTPPTWPAAIDTTASQGRSWVGFWNADPPDPAILPPDYAFGLIDSLVEPGNWLIRGYGQTSGGPTNTPPTLAWTGEPNYTTDGLHPESGAPGDDYAYRIKYAQFSRRRGCPRLCTSAH
ncbi:hypothetical protein ACFLYD_09210, partial [Chloroflexota bacterium]